MSNKQKETEEMIQKLYRYDNIAMHALASVNHVDDKEIKRFHEQGYMIIQQVLTPAEVQAAKDALMDIIHQRVKGPKIQIVKDGATFHSPEEREFAVRKIYDYMEFEPRLHHIVYHQGITGVLEKIFKEKVKVVQNMALLKPPFGGGEKPWHQDMAYGPLTYDRPPVGVWIALDEADLDNGCMHIIPRSHMEGAVPHYAERDWQLCDSSVQIERDLVVPLKPGSMLFFSGLLHHGTPPNFSSKRRRALQVHYVADSAQKLKPKEYKRMFTNELTGAEC